MTLACFLVYLGETVAFSGRFLGNRQQTLGNFTRNPAWIYWSFIWNSEAWGFSISPCVNQPKLKLHLTKTQINRWNKNPLNKGTNGRTQQNWSWRWSDVFFSCIHHLSFRKDWTFREISWFLVERRSKIHQHQPWCFFFWAWIHTHEDCQFNDKTPLAQDFDPVEGGTFVKTPDVFVNCWCFFPHVYTWNMSQKVSQQNTKDGCTRQNKSELSQIASHCNLVYSRHG